MSEDDARATLEFVSKYRTNNDKYTLKSLDAIKIMLEANKKMGVQIGKLKNQNKLDSKEHEERFNELEADIEKKDKIIDEMANNILQFRADTILPTDTEGIKRFFERKVEE